MGRSKMQGTPWHYETNYESIQYDREQRKNNIHSVPHKCKYNINGICKAPKFINRGLECRRPSVCSKYSYV